MTGSRFANHVFTPDPRIFKQDKNGQWVAGIISHPKKFGDMDVNLLVQTAASGKKVNAPAQQCDTGALIVSFTPQANLDEAAQRKLVYRFIDALRPHLPSIVDDRKFPEWQVIIPTQGKKGTMTAPIANPDAPAAKWMINTMEPIASVPLNAITLELEFGGYNAIGLQEKLLGAFEAIDRAIKDAGQQQSWQNMVLDNMNKKSDPKQFPPGFSMN